MQHTASEHVDRIVLPRGLLPRRPTWRFEIGATVLFHDLAGVIQGRSATAAGVETYAVYLLNDTTGRPDRVVRGDFLNSLPSSASAS